MINRTLDSNRAPNCQHDATTQQSPLKLSILIQPRLATRLNRSLSLLGIWFSQRFTRQFETIFSESCMCEIEHLVTRIAQCGGTFVFLKRHTCIGCPLTVGKPNRNFDTIFGATKRDEVTKFGSMYVMSLFRYVYVLFLSFFCRCHFFRLKSLSSFCFFCRFSILSLVWAQFIFFLCVMCHGWLCVLVCCLSFFPAFLLAEFLSCVFLSLFLACVNYFFLSAPPTPSINEKNVFNPRNSSRTEAPSL